jgi:hypothetical protein
VWWPADRAFVPAVVHSWDPEEVSQLGGALGGGGPPPAPAASTRLRRSAPPPHPTDPPQAKHQLTYQDGEEEAISLLTQFWKLRPKAGEGGAGGQQQLLYLRPISSGQGKPPQSPPHSAVGACRPLLAKGARPGPGPAARLVPPAPPEAARTRNRI